MTRFCLKLLGILGQILVCTLSVFSQPARGRNSRMRSETYGQRKDQNVERRSTWNYVRSNINYDIQMFPPNWWLCISEGGFSGRDLEFSIVEIGRLGGGQIIKFSRDYFYWNYGTIGRYEESLGLKVLKYLIQTTSAIILIVELSWTRFEYSPWAITGFCFYFVFLFSVFFF